METDMLDDVCNTECTNNSKTSESDISTILDIIPDESFPQKLMNNNGTILDTAAEEDTEEHSSENLLDEEKCNDNDTDFQNTKSILDACETVTEDRESESQNEEVDNNCLVMIKSSCDPCIDMLECTEHSESELNCKAPVLCSIDDYKLKDQLSQNKMVLDTAPTITHENCVEVLDSQKIDQTGNSVTAFPEISQKKCVEVAKSLSTGEKRRQTSMDTSVTKCVSDGNKESMDNITDVYSLDDDKDEPFTGHSSLQLFRKGRVKSEISSTCDGSLSERYKLQNGKETNSVTIKKETDKISESACTEMLGISTSEEIKVDQEESKKCGVVYVYSKKLVQLCDQMQKIPNRASMVHSLISAYGLTRYVRIVEPRKATDVEIKAFHDPDYVEFLKHISDQDDTEKFENDATQYGLSYDCPVHQGLYEYASLTAGATIVAAECLIKGLCKVAINWCGGWHHAAKDQASGFCYINDIVLGILKLTEKYNKILYVDLDLHHGDGVEDAFSATTKVMTVSFHKYAPGFFPGTGGLYDTGIGKGQYFTVNVPLLDGIRDTEFTPLVCRVLNKVKECFKPEVVVCQCGADGLAGDPMESFNLTHRGLGKCVYFLLQWNIPTLILGGGGYNFSNTARCWTFLTALAAGKQLPVEIPDHQFFMDYGPGFDLEIQPGNRKNNNTAQYLRHVYGTVMNNLNKIDEAM